MPASTNHAKISTVSSSATSVAIVAAKQARRGGVIYNSSTAILYLRYGGGTGAITAGNYTVAVAADGSHEILAGFKGAISGIWAAANGFANVTELS